MQTMSCCYLIYTLRSPSIQKAYWIGWEAKVYLQSYLLRECIEWLKHVIFYNWKFCSILENLFQLLRNCLWLYINTFIWILTFIQFFVLIGITAPSWSAIFHMNYCTFLHSKIYVCKKSIQIGSYNNLQMMQKYFLKLQRGRKSVENCRPWNNLCFEKRPE